MHSTARSRCRIESWDGRSIRTARSAASSRICGAGCSGASPRGSPFGRTHTESSRRSAPRSKRSSGWDRSFEQGNQEEGGSRERKGRDEKEKNHFLSFPSFLSPPGFLVEKSPARKLALPIEMVHFIFRAFLHGSIAPRCVRPERVRARRAVRRVAGRS